MKSGGRVWCTYLGSNRSQEWKHWRRQWEGEYVRRTPEVLRESWETNRGWSDRRGRTKEQGPSQEPGEEKR